MHLLLFFIALAEGDWARVSIEAKNTVLGIEVFIGNPVPGYGLRVCLPLKYTLAHS